MEKINIEFDKEEITLIATALRCKSREWKDISIRESERGKFKESNDSMRLSEKYSKLNERVLKALGILG